MTFERREHDGRHGFELGDLTVATPRATVTSKGRTPDAGMMIYLALADLFTKTKDQVAIRQGKTDLGAVTLSELAACVAAEADRFGASHPLGPGDSAHDDDMRARGRLAMALAPSPSTMP